MTLDPVGDHWLGDAEGPGELLLVGSGLREASFEALHRPANIGHNYLKATGRNYSNIGQSEVVKMKVPPSTVWERVREALKDAGLISTQKNAARIAEVKQASVSGWNVAGNNISIDSAVKISKATGVAVEYLVTGRGPKYIGPPNEDLAKELWRLWPFLPEGIKGRLVGIAGEHAAEPEPPTSDSSSGRAKRPPLTPHAKDGPITN